ncbi:MAG: hypothetical protein ISR58_15200 [Anaerolineales bacterium]|nr:hypothetical protein [Chloroflexota bacterium]MBL6982524.1 hypothetical protein [Anaerolineales bacterium]
MKKNGISNEIQTDSVELLFGLLNEASEILSTIMLVKEKLYHEKTNSIDIIKEIDQIKDEATNLIELAGLTHITKNINHDRTMNVELDANDIVNAYKSAKLASINLALLYFKFGKSMISVGKYDLAELILNQIYRSFNEVSLVQETKRLLGDLYFQNINLAAKSNNINELIRYYSLLNNLEPKFIEEFDLSTVILEVIVGLFEKGEMTKISKVLETKIISTDIFLNSVLQAILKLSNAPLELSWKNYFSGPSTSEFKSKLDAVSAWNIDTVYKETSHRIPLDIFYSAEHLFLISAKYLKDKEVQKSISDFSIEFLALDFSSGNLVTQKNLIEINNSASTIIEQCKMLYSQGKWVYVPKSRTIKKINIGDVKSLISNFKSYHEAITTMDYLLKIPFSSERDNLILYTPPKLSAETLDLLNNKAEGPNVRNGLGEFVVTKNLQVIKILKDNDLCFKRLEISSHLIC